MIIRPMKPCKYQDWNKKFPVWGQPKLDGLRMIINEDGPQSASGKMFPNRKLQALITETKHRMLRVDGELIDGVATAPDVYRRTMSTVMAEDADISNLHYLVFDSTYPLSWGYADRRASLEKWLGILRIKDLELAKFFQLVPQTLLRTPDEVEHFMDTCLTNGYEGAILRGLNDSYKQGRTTRNQTHLIKYKPVRTADATIIGFESWQENQNPATLNAFGLMEHSSHQANKVEVEALGSPDLHLEGSKLLKVGTGLYLSGTPVVLA